MLATRAMQLENAAAIAAEVDAAMAEAVRAVSWIGDPVSPRAASTPGGSPAAPRAQEPQRAGERMSELLVSPELFSIADLLALARQTAGSMLLPLDSALQVLRARVSPEEADGGPQPRGGASRPGEEETDDHDGNGRFDGVPAEVEAALRAAESSLRAAGFGSGDHDNDDGAEDAEVEAVLASALRGDL